MTEAEWLASVDPAVMLKVFQPSGSPTSVGRHPVLSARKLRLFACAATRLAAPAMGQIQREDVETAERFADGMATLDEMTQARIASDLWCCHLDAWIAAEAAARMILPVGSVAAALLRDIVGSPFYSYHVEEDDEITSRNDPCTDAQVRHPESVDQGGGSGRVEDAGGLGVGGRRGAAGAGRISDSPHQRRQHGRQADQSGSNHSRGTSSVPRGEIAGAADGPEVPTFHHSLRPVQGGIPGAQTESQSPLPGMSQSKQARASRKAIPANWRVIKRSWLTPTVLGIARRIYDARDYAGLPVLADALEDAGCTNEDVLRHCRRQECCNHRSSSSTPDAYLEYFPEFCPLCKATGWRPLRGPHVRGCWCLDLILGKE